MNERTPIAPEHLKQLQTLYSQFAAAAGDARVRTREERLLWASFVINRRVESFSELTAEEAATCIERLKKDIPGRNRRPRKPMDRDRALRHGKDGRYDSTFVNVPELAGAYDLEQIEQYYHRLGWGRDTFDAWLRSPRSPLGRRSRPQVRTIAEANRVRWALKRILQKRGLWEEHRAS